MISFILAMLLAAQDPVPESYCDHLTGTRIMDLREAVSDMALRDTATDDPDFMRAKGRLMEAIRFDAACRSSVFGNFSNRGVRLQQHLDALESLGLPENHPDLVFVRNALAAVAQNSGLERAGLAREGASGGTTGSIRPPSGDEEAIRQALYNDQQLLNYHRVERDRALMLVMGLKPNHPDMKMITSQLASLRSEISNRDASAGAGALCAKADQLMLSERMLGLQQDLQALQSNGYGEKHPDVIGMRKRIKNLEKVAGGRRPC